jgi:hypothetical protein
MQDSSGWQWWTRRCGGGVRHSMGSRAGHKVVELSLVASAPLRRLSKAPDRLQELFGGFLKTEADGLLPDSREEVRPFHLAAPLCRHSSSYL